MSTWDVGPFDNDIAADWCAGLDELSTPRRAAAIRATLLGVLARRGYLRLDEAAAGLAAAALVAVLLEPGCVRLTGCAPGFLTGGPGIRRFLVVPERVRARRALTPDLPGLAIRVLDRVGGNASEWSELLADSDAGPAALAQLRAMRLALGGG